MQGPRPTHLLELLLELDDRAGDQAAVDFDLGFTGAAGRASAAPLALQVGPGADEARALVFEPGELDLQTAFASAGPAGEDLEDQARAVHDLHLQRLFEIALLDRGKLVVEHGDVDVLDLADRGELLDLALAEQGRGRDGAQRRDQRLHHLEIERHREADSLLQPGVGIPGLGGRLTAQLPHRMDDERLQDRRGVVNRPGCGF